MTAAKRAPCSDQSLSRDDPMYGTASAGFTWVLLELPGAWGHSAFLQSPNIIDPDLGRAVVRRFETAKMRIAAIRRPGRRTSQPRWRWFVAHSREGSEALYSGTVDDPRDYLDIALDGSDGTLSTDPVVAICAHGKHDQCCAVRGRSACQAIAARVSRIHLGMFTFGRRPVRRHHARAARGTLLRAGRHGGLGGAGSALPRGPPRQHLPARTDVAAARRAGRAVLRPRGLRRRPHRQPVTSVGRQGRAQNPRGASARNPVRSRSF